MNRIILFTYVFAILFGCKPINDLGNKYHNFVDSKTNKYHGYEICDLRYVYHNNKYPSKICGNVYRRKCVERGYCKGNQTCISEVQQHYKPYIRNNDEEYCLCRMESLEGKRPFEECNKIK
jgi:hypothetical protein